VSFVCFYGIRAPCQQQMGLSIEGYHRDEDGSGDQPFAGSGVRSRPLRGLCEYGAQSSGCPKHTHKIVKGRQNFKVRLAAPTIKCWIGS